MHTPSVLLRRDLGDLTHTAPAQVVGTLLSNFSCPSFGFDFDSSMDDDIHECDHNYGRMDILHTHISVRNHRDNHIVHNTMMRNNYCNLLNMVW